MREHTATEIVVGRMDGAGNGPFLGSESPTGRWQTVFEDDGATGYFYALDTQRQDQPIVDALHVYDVAQVVGRERPSRVSIAWSEDGQAAALVINGHAHAVFDFAAGRGWCRSGFPTPSTSGPWHQESHAWDDEAEALLTR